MSHSRLKAKTGSVDLAVAPLPERRPELELLELAGGGAVERVAEVDGRRALVVGHAAAAVLDEIRLRRGLSLPEHDERLHRLAPLLVGDADHRALGDGRVLEE